MPIDQDEPSPGEVIDQAIAKTSSTVDSNGAYCSGWVLVATWLGSDGNYWLTRLTDERTPRFHTIGMLRTAQLQFEHEMTFGEDPD